MHRGYIAVWRKIQDHKFYRERRKYSKLEAWLDLLMEAQWREEPQQVVLGMNVFTQNYGESLKSIRTWGLRWGWSRMKVKRFLELLSNMNQIRYRNETVTTRITILNYDKYDPKKIESGTQSSRNRDAIEPQSSINNKGKKDKNIESSFVNTKDDSVSEVSETSLDDLDKIDNCPHQKIIEAYHETLPELPRIRVWDDTAKKWLRGRWREGANSLEWWKQFFEYVRESNFLMGKIKSWSADLRWLIRPSNFAKTMNGTYHSQKKPFQAMIDFIGDDDGEHQGE